MQKVNIITLGKKLGVMASVLIASAFAQQVSAQSDTTQYVLDTVSVISKRTDAYITSARPLQQLNRTELQQLGLENLADAVKKFAGASVKDYGGIGGMKTVSVRNLGAHHTAVSYDDVTISNTQAGQIDIGRYTLDNVETVSLAVGNSDDRLLSARHYASAGVLNIKTEKHAADGEWAEVKIAGGSFGMVKPSLRLWQPLGKNTSIAANAAFMRADGAYPFTLINGVERTKEKRYNSDIYSLQGEINLYHTWRDNSSLDAKAFYYYSERGLPGSVVLYNSKSDERLWDEDLFLQAVYTKHFNQYLSLKTRVKYSHSWNKYEDTDVKYSGGKRTDVARQNEYYASAVLGWQPLNWLKAELAEDVSFNDLRSNISISDNLTDPPYPKRFTSLTALAAHVALNRLHISANLVGTYATERVKAGKQPADRHRLSPAISLSYRLLNNETLYLRGMYKNTFRMPTFNDLYYIRMGNTGLRPENAHELNVGIAWSGRPVRLLKHLNLTLDAYLNNVDDKIIAFPSTYVWKMSNFGKVRIYGLDITIATEIPVVTMAEGKEISLLLSAAYTWQKATDKERRSPTYNCQMPYTPRESGNASAVLRTPYVNIGYSLLSQGKRWSSPQEEKQYELKGYWDHTLTLSRDFTLGKSKLSVQASINNLTGERYEIIKYYPMPGRSFVVAATLKL